MEQFIEEGRQVDARMAELVADLPDGTWVEDSLLIEEASDV